MRSVCILSIAVFILLSFPHANAQEIYFKWVDEKGVPNFVDSLDKVPKKYFTQVELKKFPPLEVALGYPPPISPALIEMPSEEKLEPTIEEARLAQIRNKISILENRLRWEKARERELSEVRRKLMRHREDLSLAKSPDFRIQLSSDRIQRLEGEIDRLRAMLY